MKNVSALIVAVTLILSANSYSYAGGSRVNGVIIGGGAGAVMGQAIGRNVESTLLGATVGGILGAVIATENSRNHHNPIVVQDRPRGPHGRDFNYAPRHQRPEIVYIPVHQKRYAHTPKRGYSSNYHHSNRGQLIHRPGPRPPFACK
ncbi:hypothetical protein [Desulforhopalus sp. IMCC35007]|uniref:hypothetical protein n=1 Tax=Desulforhopalus sp. IMCC35007 TaxID=2569543 RepID=UPI0010ADF64A|nr:hypothetical protein [Desulforhopalus sp. IMCC35007]TKB09350.1 hypothetical protein FCL48_10360 [Desulforhopalus sp. IMCC35007]